MAPMTIVKWVLRIIVAGMMAYAGIPKLLGAQMSVDLFSSLGVEPWGRYLTGILELLGGVLILIPGTVIYGAGLVIVVMLGALGAHATMLGFAGQMMTMSMMALGILILAAIVAYLYRHQLNS